MLVKLVRTFIGAYSKSQMPQLLSKNISLESVGENNGRLHFLTWFLLSLNFGLSTYLSQKVKWFPKFGLQS